jgi:hypothetical protein
MIQQGFEFDLFLNWLVRNGHVDEYFRELQKDVPRNTFMYLKNYIKNNPDPTKYFISVNVRKLMEIEGKWSSEIKPFLADKGKLIGKYVYASYFSTIKNEWYSYIIKTETIENCQSSLVVKGYAVYIDVPPEEKSKNWTIKDETITAANLIRLATDDEIDSFKGALENNNLILADNGKLIKKYYDF